MRNKQSDADITSLEDYYGFGRLADDTDTVATDARDDAAAPVKQEADTPEETEHEAMIRFFFGKTK